MNAELRSLNAECRMQNAEVCGATSARQSYVLHSALCILHYPKTSLLVKIA
jgi:hypothetical protein